MSTYRQFRGLLVAALVLAALPRAAHGQPTPTPTPTPAPAPEPAPSPTAAPDTTPAPLPTEASGIAVDEPTSTEAKLRWIPRVVFFVPRWVFWAGMQPFRLGAWAYERYNLGFRIQGALFSVDQSYGIYPVASITSDYGFSPGLRFVHYNLFGHGERLKLRANFGGEFRQAYGFELSSGHAVHRLTASLEARYERRPNERFFGIGNTNTTEGPPPTPIDPVTSDQAIDSRFREDLWRAVTKLDAHVAGDFSLRFSGALTHRTFASTEADDGIANNYDVTRLVGFTTGVDNIYLEGQAIYDSRRPTSKWMTQSIDATGWFAAAYVGRASGLWGDPTAFNRYGGELQRFFDLYNGSRILTLRAALDAISGSNGRDENISFIDLPRLGGTEFLRGYPTGRFRDRAVTLLTAEYTWDLGNYLSAYTFVDAGRAWHSLRDIEADEDELRVSFGGGIHLHTYKSFITRAQLAISRDGNTFFELSFSPAFGRRDRAGIY